MIGKIISAIDKTIWFSYLALAVVTPLIFSTKNSELFEVPKMFFVYFFAVTVLFLTLIKFVLKEKVEIPKNLILLTFLIFIAVQTLSAFFSIDKFTSIFGYPSRLNGGLLSQFAYFVIFAGALVNISRNQAKKLLLALVISVFAVSLWGIPAHFGKDPSCLVLTGKLNSTCWIQEFDPKVRIFSTLGQPNWLASFLVLALPLAVSFFFLFKKRFAKIFLGFTIISIFSAFIFTNSRAGAIGIIVSLAILILLFGMKFIKENKIPLTSFGLIFLAITLIFGTTLFSRIGEIFQKKTEVKSTLTNQNQAPKSQTVLATGGTESGQIRLIVWQGAFDIFKRWPILGSGPETFAYSYYLFRPLAHNKTTEWNFFYNKAHNEFLNYLATTGLLGTGAYLVFITLALLSLYKISRSEKNSTSLLAKASISAIVGYHATIFFGFSTVPTQVFMYLLVSATLVLQNVKEHFSINLDYLGKNFRNIIAILLLLTGLFTISIPIRFYFADLFITRAKNTQVESKSIASYNLALSTFPFKNPFYLSEFSLTLAGDLQGNDDPKIFSEFSKKSASFATLAQKTSPENIIVVRRVANTYLLLALYDKNYQSKALDAASKITKLAPTDPQSYLTLAKVQAAVEKPLDAQKTLKQALALKPDYLDAKDLLDQLKSSELK